MTSRFATPGATGRVALGKLGARASRALTLCADADRLAADAWAAVGVDDDRLFSLLEQREQTLADLSEHLVALQLERPSADNPLFAASERAVDDADHLITEVCQALTISHRATMSLAVRVAARVDDLRTELASVRRAGSAGIGYASRATPHSVDRIR